MVRKSNLTTASRRSSQLTLHIGRKITKLRNGLGISIADLARQAGLTPDDIVKYEAGTERIHFVTLNEIANIMEVPVEFFLEDFKFDRDAQTPNSPDP